MEKGRSNRIQRRKQSKTTSCCPKAKQVLPLVMTDEVPAALTGEDGLVSVLGAVVWDVQLFRVDEIHGDFLKESTGRL